MIAATVIGLVAPGVAMGPPRASVRTGPTRLPIPRSLRRPAARSPRRARFPPLSPGAAPAACGSCARKKSLRLALRSIRQARTGRVFASVRASSRSASAGKQARRWARINRRLRRQCRYRSMQKAVTASGQQRPHRDHAGPLHGSPSSRARRINDPRCNPVAAPEGRERRPHAELRVPGHLPQRPEPRLRPGPRRSSGKPLADAARPTARASPTQELGECVRCNLQIEGSGAEAERREPRRRQGLQGTRPVEAKPGGYAKHVVLRVDRADGFVGRNMSSCAAPTSSASTPRRPTASCSTRSSSSGTPTTAT